MRNRMKTLLWVAATLALALLVPAAPAPAQSPNYDGTPVIPRPFVGPLSHPRYEEGGFYTSLEFLYFMQRNPIGDQVVAYRGFRDFNSSIPGLFSLLKAPGFFYGSGDPALSTSDLRGPQQWQPGFNLTFGYRLESGTALQLSWWHLTDARYASSATLIPQAFDVGIRMADSFLYSPVFNFPPEFAGNPQNISLGTAGATYGIWNAASVEQIKFEQQFNMVEFTARIPVIEADNYRSYGIFGPRTLIMWENFRWRTVDISATGFSGPNTVAIYDNTVSNRLYGLVIGSGNEYRLCDTPVGTFSFFADLDVALYADFAKGRARYRLEDRTYAASYKRNMVSLAPGFNAKVGFQWYIYEAIQLRLGYNYLAALNTFASPEPIDFDFGNAHPQYPGWQYRFFTGIDFGICFVW